MSGLPEYDEQLSTFHEAFERELRGIIDALPLKPGMRVLDVACGDGFYARLLSEHAQVTGVDVSPAYLSKAKQETPHVEFVLAPLEALPFPDGAFDFVWCAQSLYSLPDPLAALGHMSRVLRPGGVLAVLENDTAHQVLLPWPASLELQLREAELRALRQESGPTSRYYVGRRLPQVFAEAGLTPTRFTTYTFDRLAPMGRAERRLLELYLEELDARVSPHLDAGALEALRAMEAQLPSAPQLSLTWLNMLTLGTRSADAL
jgi:ubiquinone/menaquinone biosynthesis C-methylase UbiE